MNMQPMKIQSFPVDVGEDVLDRLDISPPRGVRALLS
jgi:hypothetical protein